MKIYTFRLEIETDVIANSEDEAREIYANMSWHEVIDKADVKNEELVEITDGK